MRSTAPSTHKWYKSSKALVFAIAIPVLALTLIDGIHSAELVSILVALAIGMVIAHRNDMLEEQVSRMHRLLDEEG